MPHSVCVDTGSVYLLSLVQCVLTAWVWHIFDWCDNGDSHTQRSDGRWKCEGQHSVYFHIPASEVRDGDERNFKRNHVFTRYWFVCVCLLFHLFLLVPVRSYQTVHWETSSLFSLIKTFIVRFENVVIRSGSANTHITGFLCLIAGKKWDTRRRGIKVPGYMRSSSYCNGELDFQKHKPLFTSDVKKVQIDQSSSLSLSSVCYDVLQVHRIDVTQSRKAGCWLVDSNISILLSLQLSSFETANYERRWRNKVNCVTRVKFFEVDPWVFELNFDEWFFLQLSLFSPVFRLLMPCNI